MKQASPVIEVDGIMSIRASPQQRIIVIFALLDPLLSGAVKAVNIFLQRVKRQLLTGFQRV